MDNNEAIDYKLIGEKIRNKRKEVGVTQEVIAESINITPSFYSHIENGSRKGSLVTYIKIANYLEMSLDYMLKGHEIKHSVAESLYSEQLRHKINNISDEKKLLLLDLIAVIDKYEIGNNKN